MLRDPVFWWAAGVSLLLLLIFSHTILWVPLLILTVLGLLVRKSERAKARREEGWRERDGVRFRWLDDETVEVRADDQAKPQPTNRDR